MQTRAVIFDVDGTLVDTVDLHAAAWVQAFRRFGIEASHPDVRSQIGKGGDQLLPVFVPPAQLERDGEALQQFRAELFKREFLPKARAFPGVRALFERLRADGRRVAIGSSCKADELGAYLRLADVEGLAEVEVTGDDAEHSKPHPDIFLAALERLHGVTADAVVVVGDSPFDAQAALAAGMTPVGVLCGGFPENDLRAAGCAEVFRGPADLLAELPASRLAR